MDKQPTLDRNVENTESVSHSLYVIHFYKDLMNSEIDQQFLLLFFAVLPDFVVPSRPESSISVGRRNMTI